MAMAAIPANPSYLLLFIVALLLATASSESDSDRVAELLSLQARSKSGVIRLDDHSVKRFLSPATSPRSYAIALFFDAAQLHDKAELRLQDLRAEFGLLATSFIANNNNKEEDSPPRLFFCDIEFTQSQATFAHFGVNSVPHIRLVSGDIRSLKDADQMHQGDLSRLADSMADFIESRTKLSVGPIRRPPMFSNKQLAFFGIAILVWVPFVAKKILKGDTLLHDSRIWLAFAVFVYFFSVSGAMHNIIRKMPMFLADRNDPSKLVFFYQGSGVQLGAEGFAVGFLYTIVGLLLAFVTHILPRAKNVTAQRGAMIVALIVSFWAVRKVVQLDNWKTGYGIHVYWPSSW